ncbi:hypothetical protein [Undibacterium terreum]|uniref:hypothetical protein n=1 Tax=Undibacterium terreum TaxID=1224302 RepID=UPI00166D7D1B|nr:hypothetical protein [Undibacterium terreum]
MACKKNKKGKVLLRNMPPILPDIPLFRGALAKAAIFLIPEFTVCFLSGAHVHAPMQHLNNRLKKI